MIFITDELGKFEKNIIELAENMGFKECKTIEAIDLFCGISEKNDVLKEKDRYYAFIDIPQYWSVRADGLNGAIYDNKTKKANIYFKNPIEKRMVSRVEWIDRNNTVYRIDYYNKYGYMYCSENVSGGNVTVREFYDRNGDIKVLEQTGPKTYTTFGTRISPKSYRGFADYLEAYLKYNKIYDENIWLTSDEILNKFAWDYGNFKISYLPQNRLNSDLTVITQTNTAFRILCSEEQQVNWYKENSNYKCDRVYSYFENNELKFGKKEALTITESDQLEYIEQLINDFPEITFHIAASTIMSDKLTRLDINNNVELYPCITEQKRKELFERCDIYLDINHYRELYNAVNEAMVNNMIILAFDNTAHSKELYPMGNIFESSNYVKMKETLKNIITSQTIFNEYIDRQKKQLKQLAAKVVMQDNDGCLAFIDMDNLKKVNDVHGHKAGDRALKLIGNLLAKETENETFAACRLGGDEFLIFMPYSDRASVESVIKRIFEGFESAREADCEIKEAALSAGLCMTTKGAMFESDYTKADKALYYVKQNCKGSYFFYEQLLADNKENTNLSADLRNVAKLLKESGSYTGALDLNYREFARIYEFVNNVGDRHNHNCYLVMVTMNTLPEQLADIEEIEKALDCMEQSIRSKIRKVDVCTRYSSMQYLIILFEPQENQIPNVMERIFMHYYELCDRENFKPQYEYIKMTEVK